MRAVGAILLAVWSSWLFCQPAFAEKRVALVMGNSAYQHVGRLANPTNDSEAISATLKGVGFTIVELKRDLKAAEMRRALRDFSDQVRDADVAVVYFAGHGIEIDGVNYVIPTDAVLERDIDAFDEAIPLERILTVIEPAKQLRLVILDACRDNPFNKSMKRTIGSRSISRGLAKVEPGSPNTLIAFAAKAGSTASDGDTKNSPFTAALVKHLPKPGLDLRKAFGFTRDEVLKATNNRQEPFVYGSLGGDDVVLVPAAPAPAAAAPDAGATVRRDYEYAERVGTREAWDFFLSAYPDGFYSKLAQAQRNKLAAEEARVSATQKARVTAEEQARLSAEGAKASEQAKAASQAKAAEEARLAAEKKKASEETKVAEAERAKAAAQAKAAEDAKLAAERNRKIEEGKAELERLTIEKKKLLEEARAAEAERAKAVAEAKAADAARLAAEKRTALEAAKAAEAEQARVAAQLAADRAKAATENRTAEQSKAALDNKSADDMAIGRLASLTPADQTASKQDIPAADIPRLLQTELRRVGCHAGAVDGNWNESVQKSLALFNKNAGTTLDVKVASLGALDAVRARTSRTCPLVCDRGYKADGDACSKISCKSGFHLGDDNSCERTAPKKPVAAAPAPRREPAAAPSRSGGKCFSFNGKSYCE